MASKQTYPCFACRKAGHEVSVFLDGKDEQNRTKYLNEDGTKHVHKTKEEQQKQQHHETLPSIEQIHNLLASIDGKLDRLLNLAERK